MTPDYIYKQSFQMVEQADTEVLKTTPAENILFMGDSAGGGYTLGLYFKLKQKKKKKKKPVPGSIVLISPWRDVSLENPEIYKYLMKEPLIFFIQTQKNFINNYFSNRQDRQ